MQNYSCDQSEDALAFSSLEAVLLESGYNASVFIDAADTDAFAAAAVTSQQLPGMLCTKRKHETIFCLVADEIADCIVQLHCITG